MTGVVPPAPFDEPDVFAAAYLGVRPGPRPEGMDDRYIREPFLDLSQCLVPVGPRATWAGSDVDKDLLALGVPAGAVNAVH